MHLLSLMKSGSEARALLSQLLSYVRTKLHFQLQCTYTMQSKIPNVCDEQLMNASVEFQAWGAPATLLLHLVDARGASL